MNPQMNKVFSKLAKAEKTELASEKVELGIDDYQRYLKESFALRKKIEAAVSEFVSVKKTTYINKKQCK